MKKCGRCTNLCALTISLITFAIVLHLIHNAYFPIHDNVIDQTLLSTKVAVVEAVQKVTEKPVQKAPLNTARSIEKLRRNLAWSEFVGLKKSQRCMNSSLQTITPAGYRNLITCPSTVVDKLKEPALNNKDFRWCLWAVDPKGGAVIVGKSWGKLTSREQRTKFDSLNCNGAHASYNPSCDDAWGDNHIYKWRNNIDYSIQCDASRPSSMNCYKNENNDKFCVLENIMIDFSKYKKINNPLSSIPSKKFQQDFISMDCHSRDKEPGFTFPHLLSPSFKSISGSSSEKVCDYVIEDTVLLYSHDNIRNLAHTMNDIMNVWLMLWLDKQAEHSANITFLTIDALKQYNNFDDIINEFYTVYQYNFKSILRGIDFQTSTVCMRRVLTQPLPSRGFVWDNWHSDLPCSYLGPSSLYQRWNLHIRNSYNLLPSFNQQLQQQQQQQPIKIVFIVRTESKNDWGSYRSSRLILNIQEVAKELERFRTEFIQNSKKNIEIVLQNLADLTIEQQMLLLSKTSVLIGVHGAGISQSQYLPIGSPNCCGVIEIFPKGEFTPVKGFANMIRKMGASYDRIDILASDCHDDGAKVPIQELRTKLEVLLNKVEKTPSCVLPQVLNDPYLMTTTA